MRTNDDVYVYYLHERLVEYAVLTALGTLQKKETSGKSNKN